MSAHCEYKRWTWATMAMAVILLFPVSQARAQGCVVTEDFEAYPLNEFPEGCNDYADVPAEDPDELTGVHWDIGPDGNETQVLRIRSRSSSSQGVYWPINVQSTYWVEADIQLVQGLPLLTDNIPIEIGLAVFSEGDPYWWSMASLYSGGITSLGWGAYSGPTPLVQQRFTAGPVVGKWYRIRIEVDTALGLLTSRVVDLTTGVEQSAVHARDGVRGEPYDTVYVACHHRNSGDQAIVLVDNVSYCDMTLVNPVACFTMDPDPAAAMGSVEVHVEADCSTSPPDDSAIETYEWDFGDGRIALGPTADHTYLEPGRYELKLTVLNNLGGSDTVSEMATVLCPSGDDVTPWTAMDIGEPGYPGSSWLSQGEPGCYQVCAGGTGVTAMSDEFHFLHREATGDFSLVARILETSGTGGVGLMAREGDHEGSRHVTAQLGGFQTLGGSRVEFLHRVVEEGATGVRLGDQVAPPLWLRLDRHGDDVTAFYSLEESPTPDSEDWTLFRSQRIVGLSPSLLVGVAATGGDPGPDSPFVPMQASICSLDLVSPQFVRGNCNDDADVDMADAIFVLSYLFLGGVEPACLKSCDHDDSGELEITDGVYLLDYLFLGGPPPEAPFPACGADTTADELTCELHSSCQ